MNQKDKALRMTAKFLTCVSKGAPATPEEFKVFADLCWLSVPMKYRMTKEEIADIASKPWNRGEASAFPSSPEQKEGE